MQKKLCKTTQTTELWLYKILLAGTSHQISHRPVSPKMLSNLAQLPPSFDFFLTATPKIPFLTQSSRIVMNIHSRGRSAFRPNVQILLLLLLLPQASHPKPLFCYSPPSPFFASSVIRRIPSLPGFCIFGTNKTSDSHPFFVFLTFSCIYF